MAQERKVRGLTQRQLAERAHVSLSLLRKVEQGSAPASPAFTAAVATALRTTVAELYDQPTVRYGAERDHVAEVETAVMEGPASLSADPVPSLDVLAAQVDQIAELQRRSHYRESSARMPALLAQVHTAAAPANTPKEIVRKISDAIGQGLRTPELRARIQSLEAEPLGNTPDQMREMIKVSEQQWGPVATAAKISVD